MIAFTQSSMHRTGVRGSRPCSEACFSMGLWNLRFLYSKDGIPVAHYDNRVRPPEWRAKRPDFRPIHLLSFAPRVLSEEERVRHGLAGAKQKFIGRIDSRCALLIATSLIRKFGERDMAPFI